MFLKGTVKGSVSGGIPSPLGLRIGVNPSVRPKISFKETIVVSEGHLLGESDKADLIKDPAMLQRLS